ncbi:MAG: lipopolysaccharide biosynthesis protein [Planctomycetota bacterium]
MSLACATASKAVGDYDAAKLASSDLPSKDSWRVVLALADQAFVSSNTFLTVVLIAKFALRVDFNLFVLGFSIFAFFKVAFDRSLSAPYAFFSNQPEREQAPFLGSSLIHCLVLALGSCLLMQVCAVTVPLFASLPGISATLAVFGLIAPMMLLRDFLRATSAANFRFGFALLLSVAAMAFQVSGLLVLYYLDSLSIHCILACVGLANLLPSILWFAMRPIPIEFRWGQVWNDWKSTFDYSKWLLLARIFPSAASSLLPWIILWILGEDAAGAFAACSSLANISMMFVYGAISFLQPRAVQALYASGRQGLARVLGYAALLFTITLSVLCVVLYFAGSWLLATLYRPAFSAHDTLVMLLALHVLLVSYSVVAGIGIASFEKTKCILWGELSYALVAVAATFVFADFMGLAGAGIALCMASSISTLISWIVLRSLWNQASGLHSGLEPALVEHIEGQPKDSKHENSEQPRGSGAE